MGDALRPFHLALPVNDLAVARDFYCGLLGCETGRTAERWIDLNFFGIVLEMQDWKSLADRTQLFAT